MKILSGQYIHRLYGIVEGGKRRSFIRRIVLTVNLTLLCVLGLFIIWNTYSEWNAHILQKKTALEEEAKILARSIANFQEQDDRLIQNFLDDVCGAMQESTSPGHHIAVQLESGIFQARAHHRTSPQIFQAMQKAENTPDGLAQIEHSSIVVGVADYDNVKVYISEYLSNIKRIIRIQIIRRVISIILTGLILAIILNIILQKMVALPLQEMVGSIRQFALGKTESRMPNLSTKELGILTDEFNHMADLIETAEKDYNQRLEKARAIQQHLLPDISPVSDIKVFSLFLPATEVAGDFYDIIRLDDNSLLFCIVDVVGHDVPAAMSAAMLKALLKEGIGQECDLSKMICRIHQAFSEVTLESDFATMILMRWSDRQQLLYYVNAGHETGYLAKKNGPIEELIQTGPILGIEGLSDWSEHQLGIESGDRLILLTDGITETLSPDGEAFGKGRLIKVINKSRKESIENFLERLMEAVTEFRGTEKQLDDITLLAMEL